MNHLKVPNKVVGLRITMCLVHASVVMRLLRTSWTNANPRRCFRGCPGNMGSYCGTFQWVDPPMCRRSKEVILGLLNRISDYESEVKRADERVAKMQEVVRHHQRRLRWALVGSALTVLIILSLMSLHFLGLMLDALQTELVSW
ncbi:hypothetical protein Salat_0507900 [Sesamum alatum]|uniref:Zinc finger GRF-type domain-containing protein n=1 Tax=Sesamum alatum TaxID=300844 RepID=A0AAE1Z3X8_9LAMI|nr:hypothetical protein Salat_0507900 [Sesamum alatum]